MDCPTGPRAREAVHNWAVVQDTRMVLAAGAAWPSRFACKLAAFQRLLQRAVLPRKPGRELGPREDEERGPPDFRAEAARIPRPPDSEFFA
eukprot:7492998-Lingulodinium_polyedra.AAC.1